MDAGDSPSLAGGRSRRSKSDKHRRHAFLAQLRDAKSKGEKLNLNKDDDQVYDLVEESEYSELVRKRMDDDWIVGDEDDGYIDDGREIFDEEEGTGVPHSSKSSMSSKKKKKNQKNPDIRREGTVEAKSRDIKSMFLAADSGKALKKKKEEMSLEGDGNLDSLLQELSSHRDLPNSSSKKGRRVEHHSSSKGKKKKKPTSASVHSSRYAEDFNIDAGPSQSQLPLPRHPPKDKNPFATGAAVTPPPDEEVKSSQPQETSSAMDISDINFDEPMKDADDTTPPAVSSVWIDGEDETSETTVLVDPGMAEEGDVFRFFWLEAFEDIKLQPGVVYLFGKTFQESSKSYVSCCLRVKDLPRKVYFLPRIKSTNTQTEETEATGFTTKDVYNEIAQLLPAHKIDKFKCKPVVKQYAFELSHIPDTAEYLEVHYSSSCPPLPAAFSGRTFSHVFGSNTSFLESLIMEKKLKGPCWLDVRGTVPINPQFSWCKQDLEVTSTAAITKVTSCSLGLPPLTVLAISLKTVTGVKDNQNEIVSVGCLVHNEVYLDRPPPKKLFRSHFAVITHPRDCALPYDLRARLSSWGEQYRSVDVEGNERALLGRLLARIQSIDPDIVLGQDLLGFEIGVLLQRLHVHSIPHWHRVGRLKRSAHSSKITTIGRGSWHERLAMAGRIICDTMISAKELIRARSYELSELVKQVLTVERVVPLGGNFRKLYSDSDQLRQLIDFTFNDAHLVLRLANELQVLQLALQITGICGNLFSRTLIGGRAERNEFLLLHAFTEKGFIPPDKAAYGSAKGQLTKGDVSSRKKPAYSGGLVLEPKKGFYDRCILLLDFNSLYPSIIQEYNICFTTVDRQPSSQTSMSQEGGEDIPELPDPGLPAGVLPTEIRKLVESRRMVKKLISEGCSSASAEQRSQWNIRQQALKLTANSMYGCLGFTESRFHAQKLAALVTYKGREILLQTKTLVEGMNLEVIYGDTDSIMVNTNSSDYDEVLKLGNKVKAEVNKLYRLLELDIDGVFQTMLLLKKKKYAALTVTGRGQDGSLVTKKELKGLDIVRRDWSPLAVNCGKFVIDAILSGTSDSETLITTIHAHLELLSARLRGEAEPPVPLEEFVITKSLTKAPEEYAEAKNQPHVQVALRYNGLAGSGGKRFRAGDTVEYIVCEDGSGLTVSQRSYSPLDVQTKDSPLVVDMQYYLAHQLHPVICRLCEPIEGTDAARIASCIGLDPGNYVRKNISTEDGETMDAEERAMLGEAEKWSDCDSLVMKCPHCSQPMTIKDSIKCLACNQPISGSSSRVIVSLTNQMTCLLRALVQSYYRGVMVCEDPVCHFHTRQIRSSGRNAHSVAQCWQCGQSSLQREMTDSRLYRQIAFYKHLLTTMNKPHLPTGDTTLMEALSGQVDKFISRSAFATVDLSLLFAGVRCSVKHV